MKTVVTKLVVKPYTNKQLAKLFDRSPRQWRREIAQVKHLLGTRPNNGHKWSIDQVIKIMELFGRPYQIIEQDEIQTPKLKLKQDELQFVKVEQKEEVKKAG
jgi:hypothetical protein